MFWYICKGHTKVTQDPLRMGGVTSFPFIFACAHILITLHMYWNTLQSTRMWDDCQYSLTTLEDQSTNGDTFSNIIWKITTYFSRSLRKRTIIAFLGSGNQVHEVDINTSIIGLKREFNYLKKNHKHNFSPLLRELGLTPQ